MWMQLGRFRPRGTKLRVDGLVDHRVQFLVHQQPAELQQRRGVGHRLAPLVDAGKAAKHLVVIDRVLQRLVGEPEPLLEKVHPPHPLQADGRTLTPPSARTAPGGGWRSAHRWRYYSYACDRCTSRNFTTPGTRFIILGKPPALPGD